MMHTLLPAQLLFAGCVFATLVAMATAGMAFVALARRRVRIAALELGVAALRSECDAAGSEATLAACRVKRLEAELTALAERMGTLEVRGQSRAFDQAIDSARRGADPGRLTEQFGLSRGEADLVARLQGRNKTA